MPNGAYDAALVPELYALTLKDFLLATTPGSRSVISFTYDGSKWFADSFLNSV